MRAHANAGLDLLLAAGTEGAARKGHFCVRAFGGVVAYPVIKQRVCAPCDVVVGPIVCTTANASAHRTIG